MLNIAILGFGIVGSGVGEIFLMNAERMSRTVGDELNIKYILKRSPVEDVRFADRWVTDFSVIENDPEVSIVAEVIGGVGEAYDYTRRAIMAGKSVVTANKELVAAHGRELMRLAEEYGVCYLFEASVGGGIPILHPLMECLNSNSIDEIFGILNGTTNYILTEMYKNDAAFDDVLAEAQRLGYAEADPTADVEGIDVCRKICILADLAFGKNVVPELVRTEGICGIAAEDVTLAEALNCRVKLLGRAVRVGDRACVYVAPHFIGRDSLLSVVDGVFNGIVVRGNAVGETLFYGRGAGQLPSASSVVADIINAATRRDMLCGGGWSEAEPDYLCDPSELESRWFVRATSYEMLLKLGNPVATGAHFGVITEKMTETRLRERIDGAEYENIIRVLD